MSGLHLTEFFIGLATAYFGTYALHIFSKEKRSRYQTMLGWLFVIWALSCLKDLFIPYFGNKQVLDYIMFVDGIMSVTYTVFLFEVTMPGWVTTRRTLMLLLPFVGFLALFVAWPHPIISITYVVFLVVYALTVVGIGARQAGRVIRYIRNNYSNIDRIDIAWLSHIFWFAVVTQLIWLWATLHDSVFSNCFYYATTIILWQLMLHHCYDLQPIVISQEAATPMTEQKEFTFTDALEHAIDANQVYLEPNLTVASLAQRIGTNRTYLSNYFSQVLNITFYDYINQLRITRRSIPMMQKHPEFTIDYIAEQSGFNSAQTFRRAFRKLTGVGPNLYRQSLEQGQGA